MFTRRTRPTTTLYIKHFTNKPCPFIAVFIVHIKDTPPYHTAIHCSHGGYSPKITPHPLPRPHYTDLPTTLMPPTLSHLLTATLTQPFLTTPFLLPHSTDLPTTLMPPTLSHLLTATLTQPFLTTPLSTPTFDWPSYDIDAAHTVSSSDSDSHTTIPDRIILTSSYCHIDMSSLPSPHTSHTHQHGRTAHTCELHTTITKLDTIIVIELLNITHSTKHD